jgi:hypothetical protein
MYFYRSLGKNGWLGNQMFQYAATFSLARHHGVEACIPEGNCALYDTFPHLTAKRINDSTLHSFKNSFAPNERIDFIYDKNIWSARDNCIVGGYLQSELYFKRYRNLILQEFRFKEEVYSDCKDSLNKIKSEFTAENICSVHFRRGDYLNLKDFHTNLGVDYYTPALSWVQSNIPNCRLLAFSDDYEWCRNNLPEEVSVFDSKGAEYDLCAMTMCNSHIIANSSFSWWGAWLAKDTKQVIAPKNWFGPKGPKAWETIYCEGWGVL